MPKYRIEIGNQKYSIESDKELSNDELMEFANTNLDNPTETQKTTSPDVGLTQSAFLGTSFGTAPLIAGGADVARNLAKKVLPAKLPEFLQKQKGLVLGTDNKNIGESFKGGRERF